MAGGLRGSATIAVKLLNLMFTFYAELAAI
jgi:hypothetical protein